MALARIITRSQACSRELALDLLARGYAVEIVSPDKIPDNIADLELRVDAGPGDQLIASVEAHDGEHSASLEFVHLLKSPMGDFIRRPPEPRESVDFSEEPVSFNAEPSIEEVELLAAAPQLAAKAVSPAAAILRHPGFDPKTSARLISPPEPLPSTPVEPPSHFAAEASTIARPMMARPTIARPTTAPSTMGRSYTIRLRWKPLLSGRSLAWYWRAALSFAAVVLVAMVLGFGIRQTGNASAPSSGAEPVEKIAAPAIDVDLLSAADAGKDSGQLPASAVSPLTTRPALKSDGNSDHAPKESPVAKAAASTANASTARASIASPRAKISPKHGDDLVARDTVIYLDHRASDKAAPKAEPPRPFARRHPSSRKHRGVIAANSVTYLNNKPAPKPAK
jgi:hypothetical protein